MAERRFNDEEVAAIFQRATEAQQAGPRQLPSGESTEGMTLQDLRDIGKQVGIDPELIDLAAKSVDRVGRPTARRFLGFPIGVGRTVDLGRKLTDAEWDSLVVDLRETFDARGTIRHEGSFRSWTNGNLHALLEPTSSGHRLRLRTVKGDAVSSIVGGLGLFAAATVGLLSGFFRGSADPGFYTSLSMIATMGAGLFGLGALRLPGWARLRRQQMEDVAARLSATIEQSDT